VQLRESPPVHLTYCLNIHPGETWAESLAAIQRHALAVRDLVSPTRPFGLGLRLSRQAALELEPEATLASFRRFLQENNLYVFTLNGFPYGAFHGTPVKTSVYTPDWRTPERLDYTRRLAGILSRLLPEGVDGSISTLPLSYKDWVTGPEDRQTIARQLAALAVSLDEIRNRSGCEIHLGLEPEPDCLLGTPSDVTAFFRDVLLPCGIPFITGQRGCPPDAARRLLLRHIGVCLDTCHMAVEFVSPESAIRELEAAGLRISKLQISAAMECPATPEALGRLREFADAVYLHQTRIRDARGTRRHPDLPEALGAEHADAGSLWRTHFHVPLHMAGAPPLATTAALLDTSFWRQALAGGISHFEIETYTYSVLPPHLRSQGVEDSLRREFEWVLARMQPHLMPRQP